MPLDKVVDSAALDDALDYTASRIRARGGAAGLIPFDLQNGLGFGDAVDAIPGVVKKSYRFQKSSSGRTEYLQNPRAPEVPKVIVVHADLDDFPAAPTNGTISLGCETMNGPTSNTNGYDNYLACTTYYNSSGAVASTYCYEGGYRPGISDDRQTIRLGVRSQTGSTFLAGVEYTVDLYYW